MQQDGIPYEELSEERKAFLKILLQKDLRKNTYDPATGILTVSDLRAEAIASNSKFYGGFFTNDPALADLRDAYSIPENSLKDPARVLFSMLSSSGSPGHVSLNVPVRLSPIQITGLLKNLSATDLQDRFFYGQDSV